MSLTTTQRIAAVLTKPALALTALLAVAATLAWATDSPAGSYQSPLQVTQVEKTVRVAGGEMEEARAECPDGSIATGGGIRYGADEPLYVDSTSIARDGRAWEGRAFSAAEDKDESSTFTISAVCARGVLAAGVKAGTARKRR